MTDFEGIALIVTAAGTLLTAMATAASIVIQAFNQRRTSVKLDALHVQGNSTAQRMEGLAREAGNLKGRADLMAENSEKGVMPSPDSNANGEN